MPTKVISPLEKYYVYADQLDAYALLCVDISETYELTQNDLELLIKIPLNKLHRFGPNFKNTIIRTSPLKLIVTVEDIEVAYCVIPDELITPVEIIASGYEWICPHCEEQNEEIETSDHVICTRCNTICPVSDHLHALG